MADFSVPMATNAEKRLPTSVERENGFPCGPADQKLFNGLFNRIESEIGEVIDYAGLVGTDSDFTQLRQAIEALIAAATGGNPAGYILMTQARARLPIHFHTQTIDGRIGVVAPATGTVRLPGGINFNHRGIFTVTTAQTDFPTDANKIYHLRWDPTNGFLLRDLASASYNPSALAETSGNFDSTYDDMLIARVTTNSSNVATITNLANIPILRQRISATAVPFSGDNFSWWATYAIPLNWARTPDVALQSHVYASLPANTFVHGGANRVAGETITRYAIDHTVMTDWGAPASGLSSEARGFAIA